MLLLAICTIFLVAATICIYYPSSPINDQLLAIEAQHGCEPSRHVPRTYFAIPAALDFLKALKEHRGLQYIQSEFAQYGHTFTQWQLGRRYIWSDEPANIKEVLTVQFPNFSMGTVRRDAAIPVIGNGIFLSEGARWAHLRSVIRPSFNRAQVADLSMFEVHLQDLFAHIPQDGTTVDLQDLLYDLTLDITTDYLFGYSINTLRPDSDQTYKDFNVAFTHGLGRIWPRTRMRFLMDIIPDPEFRKSCKVVHMVVDNLISQSLSTRKSTDSEKDPARYIYLHEVAASTDDPLELRAHVLSILMAAKDSTAAGMSSTLYLLPRHPDVWNKREREIGELNGEIPTFDQLKKLKYVYNVINEGISWVRVSCFVQNFDVICSDATISTDSNQCSSSNNRYLPS
jgi:cytochrome P450